MGTLSPALLHGLLVVGCITVFVGLKVCDIAVKGQATFAGGWIIVQTQRMRYVSLVVALLLLGSPLLGTCVLYGWSATLQSLRGLWSLPYLGETSFVIVATGIAVLSPLIVLACGVYVYRHQDDLAKAVDKLPTAYVFTNEVRGRVSPKRRVTVDWYYDDDNVLHRQYHDDN